MFRSQSRPQGDLNYRTEGHSLAATLTATFLALVSWEAVLFFLITDERKVPQGGDVHWSLSAAHPEQRQAQPGSA